MSSSEVAILKKESEAAFLAVLTVGKQAAQQLAEARLAMDPVAESMAMAFGIASLQDAIRANPQAIAVLQRMAGHKWGFKTDQDAWDGSGSAYKPDILVPCFCEAMMNQLRPISNEFNVISSSMYVTKEGWAGLLDRLPGVTEVDPRPGAIVDYEVRDFITQKGVAKKKITASVSATADCYVWGQFVQVRAWKLEEADERLQLSVIAYEIDEALDQLKGKADARILERLHQKVKALSLAGPQGVPQVERPARIETAQPAWKHVDEPVQDVPSAPPTGLDGWAESRKSLNKMLSKDPSEAATVMELWDAIAAAETNEALEETGKTIGELKAHFSARVVDELRRLYVYRQQCLRESAT
jgi:hypothetical protein